MVRITRVRRVVRRRRRPVYRGKKRPTLKGFTALQSRSIRRVIGQSEETKYWSKDLLVNQKLDPAIHSPGTDIVPLVPVPVQGTAENERVGRKITPTKCRVDVSVAFAQTNPGGTSAPQSQSWANQIYVCMYILRSKTYKNYQQFTQSTQWNSLLDNGNGNSTSFGYLVTPSSGPAFWAADTRDLMKPIETTEFALLKKKVVKLTKNVGMIDTGVAGNAQMPNLPQTSYRGSFSYKLPQLEFDDTASGAYAGYPTNSTVVLAIGWCYADNLGTYGIDATDNQFPVDQMISVSARNHVWYKDG